MGTLGRKRICKTCGVAYYDFGKKNHSCPKCNSKATSKTKQLGKNASEEASQKSLELELFEVSEADLSKSKSISSGTIKLLSSNFSPGWYAAAKTDVNERSLSQDSHALFLGAPPLKGLEVHLSSNIFKGVGAVTSARLVAAHKMNFAGLVVLWTWINPVFALDADFQSQRVLVLCFVWSPNWIATSFFL